MPSRTSGALVLGALAVACVLTSRPAVAALDLVVAQQVAVDSKPFADCSARAKSALASAFEQVDEAGTGSGHWVGVHTIDGSIAASAVVECHPDSGGYHAAFTCAVQVPPNPDGASALCTKLATAFSAAPATAGGSK